MRRLHVYPSSWTSIRNGLIGVLRLRASLQILPVKPISCNAKEERRGARVRISSVNVLNGTFAATTFLTLNARSAPTVQSVILMSKSSEGWPTAPRTLSLAGLSCLHYLPQAAYSAAPIFGSAKGQRGVFLCPVVPDRRANSPIRKPMLERRLALVIPFTWTRARILRDNRLAVTPGARLGPYEIVAQLGVGGIGRP
jgi:hypothetical protein